MRFFHRRKKISSESYYDYYGDHGVVPNTIEYYLEFGQEVEAEDVYWDDPAGGISKEEVDDDDGNTTVSYKPGNIPVLTIVDASTNVPISSTPYRHEQPTTTFGTNTTGGYSSPKLTYSEYTDDTRGITSYSEDEDEDDEDVVEPGTLEATLSDYEGKLLRRQESMGAKSTFTISTVGFKSAAASAAAAQEFASHYIRYKSRDGSTVTARNQGEVEVEKAATLDADELTLTTSPSKSVITAPRKSNNAAKGTRIILHADEAGESTIAMTRTSSFHSSIVNSKSSIVPAGCALPPAAAAASAAFARFTFPTGSAVSAAATSTKCVQDNAVANLPSEVPKLPNGTSITKPGAMPSLLDDDISSLRASNTAISSSILTNSRAGGSRNGLGGGLLRKPAWFRRKRSDSTRRTRFDDASTILTRATHQLDNVDEAVDATGDATTHETIVPPSQESLSPAPLAVLYDDKRNEVAWLRCAPRRRSFAFPLAAANTAAATATATILSRTEEETKAVENVDVSTIAKDTVVATATAAAFSPSTVPSVDMEESLTARGGATQDAEERDPPPSDDDAAVSSSAARTPNHAAPERGLSILGDSTCSDEESDEDSPEIATVGSTITQYKRKLEDLQRRHDAVIKMIQDF